MSAILLITAIESGFGFLLTSAIFYLVLKNGRKLYHYFFAAILFICILWDLGIFIMMVRNDWVDQLDVIARVAVYPCIIIPALIFHFANLYTGKPIKWAIILMWVMTGISCLPILAGIFYKIEGYYSYRWGNIFRVAPTMFDSLVFISWFGINISALWLLVRGRSKETAPLAKRHYLYIISSLSLVTLSILKTLVIFHIDLGFVLPLGMLTNDIFVSIIGLAIIKDRLFDITVIVKKGTIYSILAALLIFIYSLVEHLLITFLGEKVGENSAIPHLFAVAVGIAILMPVKSRIEKTVERYFAHRKLQF